MLSSIAARDNGLHLLPTQLGLLRLGASLRVPAWLVQDFLIGGDDDVTTAVEAIKEFVRQDFTRWAEHH